MPTTAVVLFTRDLRVHDHPALHAACAEAERVVPLFVLDDAVFDAGYAVPNRVTFLLDALHDLRASLTERGASLVVRRGDLLGEVRQVLADVDATHLHLSADVSRFAQHREDDLRTLAADAGVELRTHPGITIVAPGAVTPSGGDVFKVFTPYWRRWKEQPRREVLPAPSSLQLPEGLDVGEIPSLEDLVDGAPSPELARGGEAAGRERLDRWFADGIEGYDEGRNDLSADATSRLSPHLHLGTVSPNEVARRVDLRRRGHETFLQELCWRDFNHQLLWGFPRISRSDYRSQGDVWRDDPEAVAAWKEGRTGYPVVDAAMRQLRREGFMHNRARMIVASFLTKHLYVDWRVGADHFEAWLVDGDVANNRAQWQWTAGTGTDSRPNRMFNPWTQSTTYNAAGYIRRWVPELAHLDDRDIHQPHELDDTLLGAVDYPAPIVDHREARTRFLVARGVEEPAG